jgi:hypothetical protein
MPLGLHLPGRSKDDAKKEQAYKVEGYTQQCLAAMGPTSAAQDAARGELEINIHTIEDEGLMRKIDMLCVIPEKTIMLWYNSDGNIVGQGISAPPGSKDVTSRPFVYPAKLVPWALAARAAMSKVMSTRFIEKRNAIAYKNRTRCDFMKIKRTMSREDRRLFVPFLNEIELYCLTALDDCVNGQKMLALKTSGKHLKVGVSSEGSSFNGGK